MVGKEKMVEKGGRGGRRVEMVEEMEEEDGKW